MPLKRSRQCHCISKRLSISVAPRSEDAGCEGPGVPWLAGSLLGYGGENGVERDLGAALWHGARAPQPEQPDILSGTECRV